jgi:hypothetical protein
MAQKGHRLMLARVHDDVMTVLGRAELPSLDLSGRYLSVDDAVGAALAG